ncbi:hypothetical protein ACLOJK_023422 [Asimina triloba]
MMLPYLIAAHFCHFIIGSHWKIGCPNLMEKMGSVGRTTRKRVCHGFALFTVPSVIVGGDDDAAKSGLDG